MLEHTRLPSPAAGHTAPHEQGRTLLHRIQRPSRAGRADPAACASLPRRARCARLLAATALAALILLPPAPAPAEPGPPSRPGVHRAIGLRDLGLDRGVDFAGPAGYRELFFPAPHSGIEAAMLRLSINSGAAFEGQRQIQVSAGGRILLTRAIETGSQAAELMVPVDPALARDGFIQVTLRYSGATNSNHCIDERVGGDFVTVRPETALELRIAPEALADVRAVARLLPRDVLLVLPERDLERSEIAAALRAAAVLRHRGASITLASPQALPTDGAGPWSRGVVLVGRPEDFPGIAAGTLPSDGITAVSRHGNPALLVHGGEAAAASLPLLNTRWLPLADASALAGSLLPDADRVTPNLSFGELGSGLQSGELDERVQFDVNFTSDQLPRGAGVDTVKLELAVAPGSEDVSVFAFLNGRLLGGRGAAGAVPTTLSLGVPDGLISRDNTLSVRMQRPPRPGACVKPAPGQPVQLLPSSTLELSTGDDTPREFFQLPQAMRGGVDVILPADPARLREGLAHLIAIGADLLPDEAPITVRLETRPTITDRAFIAVSRLEPAETDPRLRFDQGRLAITRSDGRLLVDLANNEQNPTVAQVVRGPRATGLWLRPGRALPEAADRPVRLDRGDVAVIDEEGIALAFSAERKQVASIAYTDIRSWRDLAGEYRPWIVGGVWLVVAALFATAMAKVYRRGRAS